MIDHAAADDFSRLKAITFDLDDTLWDNSGVMQRTEQGHVDWLTEQLGAWQRGREEPLTPPIALSDYLSERQALARRSWSRRGDFSWLRERTLIQLLEESGVNRAAAHWWAALAMQRFHSLRILVTPFPDTDAMLERLKGRYRLGSITNGNVAFHRLPLARHFQARIAAGEMFAPKPDPRPFLAMLARLQVKACETLHVGDSWEEDVLPAIRLGLRAIWIAPPEAETAPLPRGVTRLSRVTELPALLGEHQDQ
ncbi:MULTISPECIES: HAD family hydrolase [unclassified Halomonas]|uniref:HAD family hydrolase n=1 Tax=unclassified Halomonas TaxID=2609666 RepID=UPI000A5888A9|nr:MULTISPECIES: HAD family hydrolase [unclassified Halomonas]